MTEMTHIRSPRPREVFERLREVLTTNDREGFADLMAVDGVVEWPFTAPGAPSRLEGREAIREYVTHSLTARQMRIEDLRPDAFHETSDPQVVIVEITTIGRVVDTGRRFELPAIVVLTTRGGEILSYRDYVNPLAAPRVAGAPVVAKDRPANGAAPEHLWGAGQGMASTGESEGPTELPRLTLQEWWSQIWGLARSQVPWLLLRRRTVGGVAAFYDMVTSEARLSFGDNFHYGYFATGRETLTEAHDALTDLVMGLARIQPGSQVLDLGCGIGAPAIRIARSCDCRITGVNASREQIRQGRLLVEEAGLSDRIDLRRGNALALDLPDASFDSVLCLESAGSICGTPGTEAQLVSEIWRVLRPGGHVGFCDAVFTQPPTGRESRALRMMFYCTGREPTVDWPGRFREGGFMISDLRDLHAFTLPTWNREAVEQRSARYAHRYPKFIAKRSARQLAETLPALNRGTYPAFSAEKQR